MYDYGARNYDPSLGRWMNVDPLAEKATDWTPYRYAFNNPLSFTDPTGMYEDWYLNDNTGDFEWYDGSEVKEGFTNLGEQRENVTVTTGNNISNVKLNPNGSFEIDGASFVKGETANIGKSSINVVSNLDSVDTVKSFFSDLAAPFFEVPQYVLFPIINQVNVIINEGVHEGGAYNSDNYLLRNTYELKNWNISTGIKTTSTGNPTREEGQEIINNTISVIPSPW
jgi:uncharacterized protein RhaS with RHS repeats